jgi:protein disulfide-isomerase
LGWAVQSQELKWHTNVKAISLGIKNAFDDIFLQAAIGAGGIRLQKEVLLTPEFAKWASDNVILVELDYQEELLRLLK